VSGVAKASRGEGVRAAIALLVEEPDATLFKRWLSKKTNIARLHCLCVTRPRLLNLECCRSTTT